MRKIVLIILLITTSKFSFTQEMGGDFSYHYMYAPEWDKAIQTYNFSRPAASELQPLLAQGLTLGFSYFNKQTDRLATGFLLSYSNFNSYAKNDLYSNALHLHQVKLGYALRFSAPDSDRGFYMQAQASAVLGALLRAVNDEPLLVDESRVIGWGIGGELGARGGFSIILSDKFALSPFVQLNYVPYYFSPQTEAVINQTKSLVGPNWTTIFSAQVGVAFHYLKRSKRLHGPPLMHIESSL